VLAVCGKNAISVAGLKKEGKRRKNDAQRRKSGIEK
jgi:hypothetical protein